MSALREAAQQALEALEEYQSKGAPFWSCDAAVAALKAALAEPEEKQKIFEKVRVRIMRTAYDCADDGCVESYNAVKVLCSDVLKILKQGETCPTTSR